ncbi:MAG: hypothetical protein ACJATI_004550 [Halioglobus sp.]
MFIELYNDNSAVDIPDEFQAVLDEFTIASSFFYGLSETSKKQYIDYIYSVKSDEAKDRKIAKTIDKLDQGLMFHEEWIL